MADETPQARLIALLERMRHERSRFRATYGGMDVVYASVVDDWADELEAALLPQPAPLRLVWLMEREVNGQTVYWDGGHAESFTRDPDKAVQWCRVVDAVNSCHPNHYAQWGWRYVEHGFVGSTLLPQPAERPGRLEWFAQRGDPSQPGEIEVRGFVTREEAVAQSRAWANRRGGLIQVWKRPPDETTGITASQENHDRRRYSDDPDRDSRRRADSEAKVADIDSPAALASPPVDPRASQDKDSE